MYSLSSTYDENAIEMHGQSQELVQEVKQWLLPEFLTASLDSDKLFS